MAEKKKGGKKETAPKQEFVTVERFAKLEDSLSAIADAVIELKNRKADVPETKEEKEVKMAGPNPIETNSIWDAKAHEILGDFLDHTEVEHEASGGVRFTVVVKLDKSNARKDYLERTKTDRRTKEVSADGLNGVTAWCTLVKQNLKRTETGNVR